MEERLLKDASVRLEVRIRRTVWILCLLLLLSIATIFLLMKREEIRKSNPPTSVSEKRQESSNKTDKEKNGEPKLPEAEKVTPAVEGGFSQNMAEATNDNSLGVSPADVSAEGGAKGVKPPPFHPRYQPSSEDPQKTIEAFLEAASVGNPENFQYFLSYEARENKSIHLVPKEWNGSLGTAVVEGKMKGDADTVKIIAAFYKGKDIDAKPVEKIGYFLVKSFGKWLVFETTLEVQ